MMPTIGAYQAKTHLPRLLARVAAGERIVITKHGVPVAVLQPPDAAVRRDASQAIAALRRFRAGRRTPRKVIRSWIEAGRD